MKNIFKTIMLTTAAAVAFTACNKEAENSFAPKAEQLRIVVKATPDDLLTEAGTKTYIHIDNGTHSILWGENEIMQIGVNDGTATTFGTSIEGYKDYWNNSSQALFAFDITPANTVEKYTLYGLYPASAAVPSSNTDPENYKVKLPATQTASLSSYDPKAYILVAKPETDVELDPSETMWTASFRRATALNKITLTGLSTTEAITKVELTAPAGMYLAGSRKINLTTGESGDIYDGGGKTESITVKLSLGATDHLDLWFTSWGVEIPAGQVLKVVAYSAAHTFTREVTIPAGRSLKFQEGCLNTATINMSSATEGVNTTLTSGNYVILAKNTANNVDYYYALKSEAEGPRMAFESYTGVLNGYYGDAALVWLVSESDGAYIIEANGTGKSGKLLGWASGNTAAINEPGDSWTNSNYLLDIDWDSTNSCYHISVKEDPTRILAKNTGSTTGFAFYAGTQYKNIIFVPAIIDNRTPVTLSFAEDAINLDSSEVGSFAGQDVVVDPNVTAVTDHIGWSYKDDAGVIDDLDSGVVELSGNVGTAVITVKFDGDDNYKPAEASYTINVTDGSTPATDYSTLETSNVTLTPGTNGSVVNVDGDATAIKVGTSSKGGDMSVTVPSGTTKLHVHAAAWKGVSGLSLNISGATVDPESIALTADDGISNSSPFTLNGKPEDFYFAIELSGITAETVITFTSSITKRFVVWGVNAEQVVDNRQDAGMSWSAEAATATFNTGNTISFTAPTLDQGNASAVTYESTDANIATIDENTGEVTIAALNENVVTEGSTTIKAVFAGDDNYKPQTVSYTLTVSDARANVPTPTFDTPEGEVLVGTEVAFECTLEDVSFHYTVNGSTPTLESTIGTSVTINEPTTVKVIAEKIGYKPSDVASASYSVGGVAANDGSLEHPYTVAEALAIIEGYSDKQKSETEVYVSGIVANVGSFNSNYHSVTYDISDDGTTDNALNIYSGKFVANSDFSSNEQIAVNDEVIVYGYLYLYGSTKEMYQSNYIYSLNGITSMPTITKTDITDVAAAGVNNANATVSLTNNDGWTASVTADGTVVTSASISGTTITYSVAANTGDARTGSIIVALSKNDRVYVSATISVGQLAGNGNTSESVSFTGSDSGGMATTAGALSGTKSGVTVDISNGLVSGEQIRIYKGATITITAPSGKNITKIEFTCTASGTTKYGPGCFAEQGGYSYSGTKGTWEGTSDSVTLTASTNQVRATEIKVTYE